MLLWKRKGIYHIENSATLAIACKYLNCSHHTYNEYGFLEITTINQFMQRFFSIHFLTIIIRKQSLHQNFMIWNYIPHGKWKKQIKILKLTHGILTRILLFSQILPCLKLVCIEPSQTYKAFFHDVEKWPK